MLYGVELGGRPYKRLVWLVEHVTGTLWALIMGPQPEEGTYTVDLRPSSSHHPERVKYTTRRLPVADSGQHDIDKRIHWSL
jgi:hypothetical protein